METYETGLSNLSYVNKDFQTIYPELLDLVKKISYKWDPTISDESDPGVVLIKLCAIIADKNNYNIDKNILEAFPISVTQEYNARPLFEQLGYSMKWYRGATTDIYFRYIGQLSKEKENTVYTIPRFSMVADIGNTIVYTITSPVDLPLTGYERSVKAIQGVHHEYLINGASNITALNLDSNNRLYFPQTNVAENGIFISNTNSENFDDWKKVDNLSVQEFGSRVYKFGVSSDGIGCFIQFPEDIEDLIGEGLNIHYVTTDGLEGNVERKVIEKFSNEITIPDPNSDTTKTINLNESNVAIINPYATTNGFNPETIEEAYKNYKKTVGVFSTLVTKRDYENYINELNLVSNCFVCDRTNDIQFCYHIMSKQDNILKRKLCIQKQLREVFVNYKTTDGSDLEGVIKPTRLDIPTNEDIPENILRAELRNMVVRTLVNLPVVDAFDLKIYALQNQTNISNSLSYNMSFEVLAYTDKNKSSVIRDDILDENIGAIKDVKSIQHNFLTHAPDRICMLKNKYPIITKIIPQYKLTELQQEEVQNNIIQALYSALNARVVDFGSEVEYEYIYDTIQNADSRIKSVVLDYLNYTTYAVYYDESENVYKEVAISDNFKNEYVSGIFVGQKPQYGNIVENISAIKNAQLIHSYENDIFKDIQVSAPIIVKDCALINYTVNDEIRDKELVGETVSIKINGVDKDIKCVNGMAVCNSDNETFIIYDGKWKKHTCNQKTYRWSVNEEAWVEYNSDTNETFIPDTNVKLTASSRYIDNDSNFVYTYQPGKEGTGTCVLYSSKINEFRDDIYVKSVLNGNTQLLIPDNKFAYQFGQLEEKMVSDVSHITTSTIADMTNAHEIAETIPEGEPTEDNRHNAFVKDGDSYRGPLYIGETDQLKFLHKGTLHIVIILTDETYLHLYDLYGDGKLYDEEGRVKDDASISSYFTDDEVIVDLGEVENVKVDEESGNPYIYSYYSYATPIEPSINESEFRSGQYTVRENESIQISSPSLINKDPPFGSFVKYQFQLNDQMETTATVSNIIPADGTRVTIDTVYWQESKTAQPGVYKFDKNNSTGTWGVRLDSTLIKTFSTLEEMKSVMKIAEIVGDVTSFVVTVETSGTEKVIKANTDYQLQSNESFTFYWKETSDEDEKPYVYRKYVEGDIIRPTFSVKSSNSTRNHKFYNAEQQNYFSEFYVGGALEKDKYGNVQFVDPNNSSEVYIQQRSTSSPVKYTYNEYLQSLNASKYVLSATQSMGIKKSNRVSISDTTNKCYWVLNDDKIKTREDKSVYVLFPSSDVENEHVEQSYTLKEGEYFMYEANNGGRLVVLAQGTKITRSTDTGNLTECYVEVSDIEEILSDGSDYIAKRWYDIPKNVNFFASEMVITSIGPDVKLMVILNNDKKKDLQLYDLSFQNDGLHVSYIDEDGTAIDNEKLSDSTAYNPNDFIVKYQNSNTSGWTTITTLEIDGNTWDGQSVLTLNTSSTEPQNLNINQKIEAFSNDELEDGDPFIGSYFRPSYILSDQDLSIDGGIKVAVNKSSDDNIWLYQYSNGRLEDGITLFEDYITVSSSDDSGDIEIPFKFSNGKYVIPIRHNCSGLSNLTISIKDTSDIVTPLTAINRLKDGEEYRTNFNEPGLYYLDLQLEDANKVKSLVISFESESESDGGYKKFIIENAFKYTENYPTKSNTVNISKKTFERLFDTLLKLDPDNQYDFSYVVDEDEKIEFPLDAQSFLNVNHIFNPFIICQMNTATSDIHITSKIK